MAKFKLLAGLHIAKDPKWVRPKDAPPGAKAPSRTYRAGDTVESDIDLVKKHGAGKFVLVSGTPRTEETPQKEGATGSFPGGQVHDGRQQTTSLPGGGQASGPEDSDLAAEAPASARIGDDGEDADDTSSLPGGKETGDATEAEAEAGAADAPQDLDAMTVAELKSLAAEEGADVHGHVKKDDIIKVIKKNRRAR